MGRTGKSILAAVVVAASLFAAPHAAAQVNPTLPAPGSPAAQAADSVAGIPGLPTGVPVAATTPVPVLPEPSASVWPFPSDFPQTEGTGRLDGGASLWTDFVYDDHGGADSPVGIAASTSVTDLAPVHGGFTYPTGTGYDGDNADIFRASVGATATDTYWRVDWNTLPDPSIPVAEWTMTPGSPTATTTAWPANAGLTTSTGIEYALVVDSQGAELLDAATSAVIATYPTSVDDAARSFVVAVPTTDLPVDGTWAVQLAAGLDARSASGPAFATVPVADGGLPAGGANAYNVTFRSAADEAPQVCLAPAVAPAVSTEIASLATTIGSQLASTASGTPGVPTVECANSWDDNDQANTLSGAAPDVSRYHLSVDWSALRSDTTTGEPHPTGYSNRWYVSPLDLGSYGAGVRNADSGTFTGPTYLSRVQPYAVYVPSGYDFTDPSPTPLTWVLHSLGANYNQYGSLDPSQLAQECEARQSICATTEGFSEGQWYYGEAEVDFFDVWHQLALGYDLDPDATAITGYSMGGWASYKLAEEYPDLFAQAMALEGPVICGEEVLPGTGAAGPIGSYAGGGQCTADGQSTPLLANTYWIPYVMTCGGIDELVPVTGCNAQAAALVNGGQRVFEALYPAEDHLVFATQNDFGPADRQLGQPALDRESDPGRFSYTWYPELVAPAGGIDGAGDAGTVGPVRDYWLSGLTGRTTSPGTMAEVAADSNAIPDPAVTPSGAVTGVGAAADPTPYVTNAQTWALGVTAAPQQTLDMTLTDVATATLDTTAAGLGCAEVTARSDGPTDLTLVHLQPGSAVTSGGATVADASSDGAASVALATGTTTLALCSAAGATVPAGLAESPWAAAVPAVALAAGWWALRRRRRR